MLNSLKPLLRISAGLALLMLGIAGLFLPILQGSLLILASVPLLSPEHGKKMMVKIKMWLGKLSEKLRKKK